MSNLSRGAILGLMMFGGLWASVAMAASQVLVSDAYLYAPIPGRDVAVAYWHLHNQGDDTALVDIRIPDNQRWARKAEIHRHLHRDGMMSMQKVTDLVLPAKGQQLFEPGGYHVMVFGVKNVQVGGQIPVVLYWQDGSQQEVLLDVRQR